MRYVRPSSFAMMKALDANLMSPRAAPKAAEPAPKAKKASKREIVNDLVRESNKVTVLGHLHPRRLRKEFE